MDADMPAKKNPSFCWFVTGSEESEVKQAAATLASELAPGDDTFSFEVIDGAVPTVDEMVRVLDETGQALMTMPMFEKLVWLKNASCFSDTVAGRSETVVTAVDRLVDTIEKGFPSGIKFLLSAPEPDKRRSAYKRLVKLAQTSLHDKVDFGWDATEADLVAWVAERAAAVGLRLEEEVAEVLAARVGADARQLRNELEKLALAAADGQHLTPGTVRDLVPPTRQGGIFDLSNCLLRRDLPGALATLDQLFRQREKGVGILLAAIVPTLRNLLLVSELMERHRLSPPAKAAFFGKSLSRLSPEETAHLPRKKDGTLNAYSLGLAAVAVRRYDPARLRAAFLRCREVNLQLVTTSLSERLVLGKLLMEILT